MRDARGSIRLGPSLVPGLVALVAVDDSEALIDRDARARRAMREARTEAVVVVGIDVALIGGRAVVDRAKGWQIVDLPWWAWLLLAAPALLLMILLLAVPLAELSPGRLRNAGVALLGLLGSPDFQFPQTPSGAPSGARGSATTSTSRSRTRPPSARPTRCPRPAGRRA